MKGGRKGKGFASLEQHLHVIWSNVSLGRKLAHILLHQCQMPARAEQVHAAEMLAKRKPFSQREEEKGTHTQTHRHTHAQADRR